MGRLDGAIAIITGGSSGIGESVAAAFSREGATVIVSARREDKIQAIANSIREAGGHAFAMTCDVTSEDSIQSLREKITEKVGSPTVVLNSAGVYRISRFLDTPLETYKDAIDVNYLGVVRMIRVFIPAMLEAGYGKIVNIASTAGKYGSMYQAHYNGSKHAVIGITKSLGLEFAKTGICVNAICPGWAKTPMLDQGIRDFAVAADMSVEDARKAWLSRIPMGRFLEPEEIGPLAIYLASRESDGMTGQAMTISGGMVLV